LGYSQVITDGTLPESLVVCGESQVIEVVVTGPFTGGDLTVTLPSGYNYVGDAAFNSGCATNSIPDPDVPVFLVAALAPAVSCTLSYEVVLDCDAFRAIDETQGGDGDFLFIINYELDGGTTGASAPTIMTQAPKLNVDIVTNGSPSPPGVNFTRTIRICQDGSDAYIDDPLMVGNDLPVGLMINSVTVQGGSSFMPDAMGMLVIPTTEFPFSKTRSGAAGNGDQLLNGSDSNDPASMAECIYLDYDMVLQCSNVDLVHRIITNWGCNAEKCAIADTTSLSTVAQIGTPILSREVKLDDNTCFAEGPVLDTLVFTNTGNGDATDIELQIGLTSSGSNYTPNVQTGLDAEGVVVSLNNGAFLPADITVQSTMTAAAMNNCNGSLGPANDNRFLLNIPELKVGEKISIIVPKYHCCRNTCQTTYYYHWNYIGTMQNACGEGDFVIPIDRVGTTTYVRLDHSPTLPSDVFDGDCFSVNYFTATSGFAGEYVNDENARAYLTINLPCTLIYDNFTWVKRDGMTTMDPLSVNYDPMTGDLVFEFEGRELTSYNDGVSVFKSSLDLDLKVDCSVCGGGSQNITYAWTFEPDATCSTLCTRKTECFTSSVYVHCPSPCPWDGITPIGFNLNRITLGLEDLDNDMCNDSGATASPDDVNTNLSTYCDQVEGEIIAVVNTDAAVPASNFFEYGYARTDGYALAPIGGRLEWWDASAMTWRVCNDVGFNSVTARVTEWDFSPATLCANGCNNICGEVFETGDTIKFYPLFENFINIGGALNQYNMDMDIYGATIPNPPVNTNNPCSECMPIIYPDNRWTCDKFSANYSLIGYYFTTYGSFVVNRTGCTQLCSTNNWYLSVGPCCGNYQGGNNFPNEYRLLGRMDSVHTVVPAGFNLDDWYITFGHSGGSANVLQPTPDRIGPNPAGDTLFFDLAQYYDVNGGTIKQSDEGYIVRFYTCITPTCAVESGPDYVYGCGYQSWTNCEGSPIGTTAPLSVRCRSTTPLYEMPTIATQSSDRIQIGDCPELDWPIRITNTNNLATANNTWVYFPPGAINVTGVTEGGVALPNANGFYEVGHLTPTQFVDLEITGDYNSCSLDSIPALIGWECQGIPTNINDLNCDPDTIWLVVEPQKPAFSVEVLQPTVSNVIAELCEEIDYELLYKNIGGAKAYNLKSVVFIPPGAEIVPGSVMIEYACGVGYQPWIGNYPTPSPTALGDRLIFNITSQSSSNPNVGLIGLPPDDGWAYPNISEIDNCYKLKFKLKPTCDLGASGQLVRTLISGYSPCALGGDNSGFVRSNLENVGSLKINGAEPYAMGILNANDINFTACADDLQIDFDLEMQTDITTGAGDSIKVVLPLGFNFVSANYGVPIIENTSGVSTLIWPINPPLMAGDMINMILDVDVDPKLVNCGSETIGITTFSEYSATCIDDGSVCNISTITGNKTFDINVTKPDLTIDVTDATMTCSSGALLSTTVVATLTNNGPAVAAGESFPVLVYSNDDGSCSIFGTNTELHTININGPIAAGAVVNISETFMVPAETCFLLLEVQDCACGGPTLVDCIAVDLELTASMPASTCHNEAINMSTCNNPLFTYTWSAELPASVSDITAGATTGSITILPSNTSGTVQTYKYPVTIERGLGCLAFDTLVLDVRPDLSPTPIMAEAVTVCPGDSQIYTYSTTYSATATSVIWSVPVGASIVSGQGTNSIDVDFGSASGQVCVMISDGTCPSESECVQVNTDVNECCNILITTPIVETCDNNGTPTDPSDDFFYIAITADANNPGVDQMYEIVYNGTVISSSPYTFETMAGTATTPPFVADGVSTYDIIIRDKNWPTECFQMTTLP